MGIHKKLIEVALPLDAINKASATEKSIRHGHPSTLHLWWARRPLAACRAVLFASLVDDPSAHPDEFITEEAQEAERQRLFRIIEQLVKWENTSNEAVLTAARTEILRSTGNNPPPVLDPFCGGGSIPLEAQRLGLAAHGSDLNPVAVLITKALVEIPPKFVNHAPVCRNQTPTFLKREWHGTQGLAEDIRYYGKWIREEAERRLGHFYPKVSLPREYGSGDATAVAWLWARTVTCPNPACGTRMPLATTFRLSTKKGKEMWAEPQFDRTQYPPLVSFEVRSGHGGTLSEGNVNRRGATCRCCGISVPLDHIRTEARAKRMGAQLMAIVAEGKRGRIYLSPTSVQETTATQVFSEDAPDTNLPEQALSFRVQLYGMTKHRDLFTARQLVALTCFSDLIGEAREQLRRDAIASGKADDGKALSAGGTGVTAYADAVATYLAFALSKMADRGSSICTWFTERDSTRNTFARQAIPMTWDYAELNPLLGGTGSFLGAVNWTAESLDGVPQSFAPPGSAKQLDATAAINGVTRPMVSTDPPYYDNIGYADLSDYFYVWLRRSLGSIYPDLFSTLLVPKSQELIATPHRFGGSKKKAQQFFEEGLGKAFAGIRAAQHPDYPLTVYYAFKQAESDSDSNEGVVSASTGWETMLEGLLTAGFTITGTWPMRSELSNRPVASGTNALASSIVLACRVRHTDAPPTTRREFINALKRELPAALRSLQRGNIAPVDLAQAAIGPGMAIFSRYSKALVNDQVLWLFRTLAAPGQQVGRTGRKAPASPRRTVVLLA